MTEWHTVLKIRMTGSDAYNAYCERLMLVETIEEALWQTRHVEGATHRGAEEGALRAWRIGAQEALRIERLRRRPLPEDIFTERA